MIWTRLLERCVMEEPNGESADVLVPAAPAMASARPAVTDQPSCGGEFAVFAGKADGEACAKARRCDGSISSAGRGSHRPVPV